jgi:hypothetical protein
VKHARILGPLCLLLASTSVQAQEWKIHPKVYARGGVTLSPGLDNVSTNYSQFNLGPWSEESNMVAPPLTEATFTFSYGENFKYHYGFDTSNNTRFFTDFNNGKQALTERVNYLEYQEGNMSLWFGSRPYRSYAEYLTRAYTFDEKNLFGGGVRFNSLGPVNVEFAYGVDNDISQTEDGQSFSDHTNYLINKVQLPLQNGVIATNLEFQQLKRGSVNEDLNADANGYIFGIKYARWGDSLLGGGLYNQFIVNYSAGYVGNHAMSGIFMNKDASLNDDYSADKILLQWNGDWKANRLGVYWASFYQINRGSDPSDQLETSEYKWDVFDAVIRAQYGVLKNVTAGGEYARRIVVSEGAASPSWAQNAGVRRYAAMLNYNLENRYFDNPVISLFVGRIEADKERNYFPNENAQKSTNFVRLNYEISVN